MMKLYSFFLDTIGLAASKVEVCSDPYPTVDNKRGKTTSTHPMRRLIPVFITILLANQILLVSSGQECTPGDGNIVCGDECEKAPGNQKPCCCYNPYYLRVGHAYLQGCPNPLPAYDNGRCCPNGLAKGCPVPSP
mmetsp:Transcript_24520/g.45070  ORF Transcript_24520/g.45070 Transcript_24520/m.45070 type:complete len:135 (+) Transcript_24520:160-564(+)